MDATVLHGGQVFDGESAHLHDRLGMLVRGGIFEEVSSAGDHPPVAEVVVGDVSDICTQEDFHQLNEGTLPSQAVWKFKREIVQILVAMPGHPLDDIAVTEQVDFVMARGNIVRRPQAMGG